MSSLDHSRIQAAITALSRGEMIIVTDEVDRENEGDFVCAAETVTPEHINFMAQHGRGLICLAVENRYIDKLELPMMQDHTKAQCSRETAFTVSIEAKEGVTTGISAADRAHTIRVAVDEKSGPQDIVVPGHTFPLKAREGGVLERAGHTEGSVDLCKLAGLSKAAVICEIMNEDGTMARKADLETMSLQHKMPIVSISEIIEYRLSQDSLVKDISSKEITLKDGSKATLRHYQSVLDNSHHLAVVKGDVSGVVDVRVHLQRSFLDFVTHLEGESRFDNGVDVLISNKNAVLLFLSKDMVCSDMVEIFGGQKPTFTPDKKHIGIGAQILRSIGVRKMKIHSYSKASYFGLAGFGLEVVDSNVIGS